MIGLTVPEWEVAALTSDADDYVYYAITDEGYPASSPITVVRRLFKQGAPFDESFTRNLTWEHSNHILDIQFGHSDRDFEEISKQQADAFVERVTARLRGGQA